MLSNTIQKEERCYKPCQGATAPLNYGASNSIKCYPRQTTTINEVISNKKRRCNTMQKVKAGHQNTIEKQHRHETP